jgi:hypothetical protein
MTNGLTQMKINWKHNFHLCNNNASKKTTHATELVDEGYDWNSGIWENNVLFSATSNTLIPTFLKQWSCWQKIQIAQS